MIAVYILLGLLGAVLLCLLIALVRTLLLPSKKTDYQLSRDEKRVECYAKKLSAMVQVETVSSRADPEIEKFRSFHKTMETLFPKVFSTCQKVEIDGNLLLKWKGKSSASPIALMSHMDVVEAPGQWKYPPFSGAIA